jgi:AbrB family looped-hinge helix DNA binding protein
MSRTRLSTKGQVIVPQEIRERHGWQPGTVLEIEDLGDGIVLRPALDVPRTTVDDLVGCVRYEGPVRTLDEIEDAIARGALESR